MVNANSKSTEATYHSRLLKTLRDNLEEINRGTRIIAENLLACHNSRGNVWLIGNGGSASTAEHFETDGTADTVENVQAQDGDTSSEITEEDTSFNLPD